MLTCGLQAAQHAVQTLQGHLAAAQLNVEESLGIQKEVLLQVRSWLTYVQPCWHRAVHAHQSICFKVLSHVFDRHGLRAEPTAGPLSCVLLPSGTISKAFELFC